MFAKLLKHEFKSCAGLMGVLSLASLGLSAAAGFMLRYIVQSADRMMADDSLGVLLSILLVFTFLTLFALSMAGWIYLCVQFYKRKFTDQGYLTFTLPVRCWQIYLSSFLNILLWSFILTAALILAFVGIFLIGFINTEIWDELVMVVSEMPIEEISFELDFMNPLYSIGQSISSILIMMNCITLGSVLAKKHKVLAAIGSYYILSLVMGSVSTWMLNLIYVTDFYVAMERMQLVNVLVYAVVGVGGAALSIFLMERKLNLP